MGFVPPEGPLTAQLMYLGQGPGEQEALQSRPFVEVAPAGGRLSQWVHKAGGQRTDALVTNVVWCWKPKGYKAGLPFGNDEPTPAEIDHCYRAHLHPLIDQMPNLRWIIPLGAPAGRWALGVPEGQAYEPFVGTTSEKELPCLTPPSPTE